MVIFQSYVINVYQRVIWLIDYETTKRYDDDIWSDMMLCETTK